MTALFDVVTPASVTRLTNVARVRSDLNLSATLYADGFVNQMIDSATAAIVAYLNIASDGAAPATLGRESIIETFEIERCGQEALILSRTPIADVTSVSQDGAALVSTQTGDDGAVDVGVDATAFSSALGPDGGGFTSSHVGKAITIAGAGAAAAAHATTIAAVIDAQNVTLADAALTTVAAAAFTIDNPAFDVFEWKRASGILFKTQAGYRAPFTARRVIVSYVAGWLLTGETGRNLPADIEDACVIMVRRRIDQLRESETENRRIKAESFPGIGSWTFDLAEIKWESGLPSDVRALIDRYKRRVV